MHISIYSDADRVKASVNDDEDTNVPQVILGSGLPDDDDDDEDFALDLQQFNEPHAFENFIISQDDTAEDQEDEVSISSLMAFSHSC